MASPVYLKYKEFGSMNVGSNLIDLEELVLFCNNQEARKYIAEAVACYKAGAYRACIVTTWIAVVYDFVNKLRQLASDDIQDKNAIEKLKEFNEAVTNPAIAFSKFESKVLEWAKSEFEFISETQYQHLTRLLNDRHLCAHPSMASLEEIYEPSAELARLHLRNAIDFLLRHEAIQGQSAVEYLKSLIKDENQIHSFEDAKRIFEKKFIPRAKFALIRNFLIAIIKSMYDSSNDDNIVDRCMFSIKAIKELRTNDYENVLRNELSKIFPKFNIKEYYRLFKFIDFVGDIWQFLDEANRISLINYVSKLKISTKHDAMVLYHALSIVELRELSINRLKQLPKQELSFLIGVYPREELILPSIRFYSEANDTKDAIQATDDLILPLIKFMTTDDIDLIIQKSAPFKEYYDLRKIYRKAIEENIISDHDFMRILEKYGLSYHDVTPIPYDS